MTVDHITKNPIERELWRQWQANPSDALRNRMLAFYDRMVKQQAARFLAAGVMAGMEFDDLYSEGWIGLCRAFDDFDCERGVLFYTYARQKVEFAIKHALRDKGNAVRLPGWQIEAGEQPAEIEMLDDSPADTPSTDDVLTHLALVQALEKLPYRERQTIIAHDLEGYWHRELAEIYGRSDSASSTIRLRGMRRLRAMLVLSLGILP
jgi:RNA polymerase sigma factor (sigma-70 family)